MKKRPKPLMLSKKSVLPVVECHTMKGNHVVIVNGTPLIISKDYGNRGSAERLRKIAKYLVTCADYIEKRREK